MWWHTGGGVAWLETVASNGGVKMLVGVAALEEGRGTLCTVLRCGGVGSQLEEGGQAALLGHPCSANTPFKQTIGLDTCEKS